MTADRVFLLDVDNTLLDGDRIVSDLREHLQREFGAAWAPCNATELTSNRAVSTNSVCC